jgi:16S rRNA (cytosine967-C5)-methyltransferase
MMLYAVCTTTHSETVKQVAKFLEYSPDARLAGPGVERGRQILPGEANMDGFYYACLYKKE